MSKFDELREAYVAARKSFFDQRDASAAFALDVIEGMERYLECPPLHVHFLSNTRQATTATAHDAKSAVTFGADGLWHFNVALELVDNKEGPRKDAARQTIAFELLVQPCSAGFNIGLKGCKDRFSLPAAGDSVERTRFYDLWFQRIIDSYLQPGQRFFENMADSDRAMGG